MTAFERIAPPELSIEAGLFANCLSKAQLPLSLVFGDSQYQLGLSIVTELPDTISTINVRLDNKQLKGLINVPQLFRWLSQLLQTNVTIDIPEPLLLALLEKSIARLQPLIQQHLGSEIIFDSLGPAEINEANKYYVNTRLTFNSGTEQFVTIDLFFPGNQQTDWLLQQLKSLPQRPPANLPQIPVVIRLLTGYTLLSPSDYNNLTAGDVVLFDHCLLVSDTLQLNIGKNPLAVATVINNSLHIQSTSGVIMEQNFAEEQLQQEPTANNNCQIESLPICLNFELGSITLPLNEVRTIAPGRVFELEGQLDSPIRLTINGKEIGRGELVKLGDRPGVRIVSFYNSGEQG